MRIDDTPGKGNTSSFDYRGNDATRAISLAGLSPRRLEPFRQTWLQAYPEIKRALSLASAPCYVLVAATSLSPRLAQLALPLAPGQCVDAILGRHRRCDLFLRDDPGVALRHVLVRAFMTPEGQPRIRVLDLSSRTRFQDETGKTCTGLLSDGHLFVSVGQYDVMAFLKTGDDPWPDDPAEAWNRLPARQILEASDPAEDSRKPVEIRPRLQLVEAAPPPAKRREDITITRLRGPSPVQELAEEPESRPGSATLIFSEDGQSRWAQLSDKDLEAGVLLGRYERCQLRTKLLRPEEADDVSRIHLCLLKDETGIWAIDTASTNGTLCDGLPIRSIKLNKTATLLLAGKLTARWAYSEPA